ncbi:hypothetical protein [Oceanobacillus sp. FSL K6-0127]|uniref:hypothetical protein n=1 Tax=Oceanobacillus sp. FSL K6-0127 TaxID=2921420 RepID=UPI0030EE8776
MVVSAGMIVLIGVVCLIAIVLILYGMKQEEDKQKKYEEAGEEAASELERSLEYETKSLKSNLPSLIWIYVVTISLSLFALVLYIF